MEHNESKNSRTQETNAYYKQFIVEYERMPEKLREELAPYEHFCSELAPYCTVTLHTKEQEISLLEVLATFSSVTYREAVTRKAMDHVQEKE